MSFWSSLTDGPSAVVGKQPPVFAQSTAFPQHSSLLAPPAVVSKDLLSDVSNSLRKHNVLPKVLFERLDSTGGSCLSRDDVYRMALMYRPNIDAVEFDELFWQMNRSCSGAVSFNEFCAALGFSSEPSGLDPFLQDIVRRIHNSLMDMGVDPEQLFRRLDVNSSNSLGPAEIGHMARGFTQQLSKVELDSLYRHFSAGTNGGVDLRMFCRALGFTNGNGTINLGKSQGDAAWNRIAQVARSLHQKGTGLKDAFQLFDSNGDGLLGRDELHRLLSTCDPSINQFESDDVFNRVAPQGRLNAMQFAQHFQINLTTTDNNPRSLGYWMRMSPPSKLDPALRSLANRICAWLDPALMAQGLGLTGQSKISRAGFDQMVLAMEPQLGASELDRLFRQTDRCRTATGEVVMSDFIRSFAEESVSWMAPGPGTDQWALALLRRVARRAAAAMSAPQDLFKRYSITVAGTLSQQEFTNMLRGQFPTMNLQEVDALWNLADADRSGRVDLYEFSSALRFLALEAQDTTSSMSNPPALGSARDQVIEARIAQLARGVGNRGLGLLQAFLPFDLQGTGFIDRVGFQCLLSSIGLNLAEWEVNEIVAWFDTAQNGRINYRELVRQFDASAQAKAVADAFGRASGARDNSIQKSSSDQTAWSRVAQVAQRLQTTGTTLHDAFRFFDSDGNGNLDSQEFFRLMQRFESNINQYESNDVFTRVAGADGRIDVNKFASAFNIPYDIVSSYKPPAATGYMLPRLEPPMHSVINRLNGWLEPALLSKSLGVTNGSRLSRADFNRMVLALEPNLNSQDLDRLFQQVNTANTGGLVDVSSFVGQFVGSGSSLAPGMGSDQWASTLLRRIAGRVNSALAAPDDIFRKFDMSGDGWLSKLEFERMVRTQDTTLSQLDVDKLWSLADGDGDGRVDLNEFCRCIRRAQLEAEDTRGWANGPPAAVNMRDRAVEVRMAQLARWCSDRGMDLARAFALYDQQGLGFIDRNTFQQLMISVGLNIADWEVNEIISWFDTARDGRMNYRELLRQFEFAKQAAVIQQANKFAMVSQYQGQYFLQPDGGDPSRAANGSYSFDPKNGEVQDRGTGQIVGTFSCEPISTGPIPAGSIVADARTNIPCIQIEDSEIMAEIQKSSNACAIFVLPSQLNGAEYSSHTAIVDKLDSYKYDNTGGPRGQLAVHPAPGQFVIDNAANDRRPNGINAVDEILRRTRETGFNFQLMNGYLAVPQLNGQDMSRAIQIVRQYLHSLRLLAMRDVPASGLTPDKRALAMTNHKVSLVYASAVPVQAYMNAGVNPEQQAFQVQVAEAVLVAQYYGALKLAAQRPTNTTIFLMPLGGGVFKNPWESIAAGMARAVEMLTEPERARLNIKALTYRGNPVESDTLSKLLLMHGKLKANHALGQSGMFTSLNSEAESKVVQIAKHLRDRGCNLCELFAFYDRNGNSNLENYEFRAMLKAIDPTLPDHTCEKIFELAAVHGRLDLPSFVRRFNVPEDLSRSMGSIERPSYALPAGQALDAMMQRLVDQILSWLEPLMLNRTLNLAGRRQISRQEFERMVQVVEPNLDITEISRLFNQADQTRQGRDIDSLDFVRRYDQDAALLPLNTDGLPASQMSFQPGFSTDRWALAALRRIARKVGFMLSGREQDFRRMDIGGSGPMTSADLHRFLMSQPPAVDRQHVDSLFQQADASRRGTVTLQEFCDALVRLQLEAERSRPAPSNVPAGDKSRDRVIEVRGVMLARLLHDRNFSLEKALALFDQMKTGSLDRPIFRDLTSQVNLALAAWEEDEFFLQCDMANNGRLDCRELVRRLRAVKTQGSPLSDRGIGSGTSLNNSSAALGSTAPGFQSSSPSPGMGHWIADHLPGHREAASKDIERLRQRLRNSFAKASMDGKLDLHLEATAAAGDKGGTPRDLPPVPPPESSFPMVSQYEGHYSLQASKGQSVTGRYVFNPSNGELSDRGTSQSVGMFSCHPISHEAIPPGALLTDANLLLPGGPCIQLQDSDITAEIQKASNHDAIFVIPSLLNGAEYPSHEVIPTTIDSYKHDSAVGPHGQLAVHPAAGQFVLDNAANQWRPNGINAMDEFFKRAMEDHIVFKNVNGYLSVPRDKLLRHGEKPPLELLTHVHSIRLLAMQNVPACGLTPDKSQFSEKSHRVSLIYASAVPVQAFVNSHVSAEQEAFQVQVADAVLFAQYYGALKLAAARPKGATIFLLPLGGGVFKNTWESIAKAMSRAVELIPDDELAHLDIRALTSSSNPVERESLSVLLARHKKLKATNVPRGGRS